MMKNELKRYVICLISAAYMLLNNNIGPCDLWDWLVTYHKILQHTSSTIIVHLKTENNILVI